MEKKSKTIVNKNKIKIIPIKNKLKKEKTTYNEPKKINQVDISKSSKINQKINISNKKYSMDNRETTSNSNTNNITDSSEILIDKKKIIKNDTNLKKINLKAKYNKNSDEAIEKNINLNNKDYNINPFVINVKSNNNNKISKTYNLKENEKEKENNENNNVDKKEVIKNIYIEKNNNLKNINSNNNIAPANDIENLNTIDFSFDKKILKTLEVEDKDVMYKNRFLTKIGKNKNNSKERKNEASFGSIIHQKKMKLFSFSNVEKNQLTTINLRESAMLSVSSKNIIHENGKKENKLLAGIKEDLKKDKSESKAQASGKKPIEKKISELKLNKLKKKNIDDNSNTKTNTNTNKDNKETIKLETKINKNREKLFNSKGKIKDKEKEQKRNTYQLLYPKIKNNNKDIKNNQDNKKDINTKNNQKKTNKSKIIIEKKIIFKPNIYENNSGNQTFNLPRNKNKLTNSNSNISKNKLEEKKEIKSQNKDNYKDKAINFKKTLSPTKINIDLELSDSKNNYEILSEKQYLISSERISDLNSDLYIYSILKDSNKNEKILYDKFKDINKSPQMRRIKDNNKIFRTKTEFRENENKNNSKTNLEINKNTESNNLKENKSIKNQNQKSIINEDMIIPLSTLDNESFKQSTVKKLIKNNQYKALLSEMQAFTKYSPKEKTKEKSDTKIKKKYRFSERRRSSQKNYPSKKLTESIENYYDYYKKAFNARNLEQKFTFRPKSKRQNFHNRYFKNNDEGYYDNDKILNKKISTISFQTNQKQTLNNDINIDDIKNDKNALSNSFDNNKLYDKEVENENDNKNFILDLNHFIPIDEKKLINTIKKPLFGSENYVKTQNK